MPFDALLININKDYCGVNVIRHYNSKYETKKGVSHGSRDIHKNS